METLAARKNVAMPADWWAAFEEQAEAEGLSLSEWLGECALDNLPPGVADKLSERRRPGRPSKRPKG